MRKLTAFTITLFSVYTSYSQTNVYPATGNVGLGTTTPSHRLTLDLGSTRNGINMKSDGDAGAYSDLMFEVKTTTSVPTGKPTMWVFSSRKDGVFSNDISGNTLEMYAIKKDGGYIAPLLFKSNGDLVLAGAKQATNGNVGVGTNAPRAVLDVGRQISSGALGTVFARLFEGDTQGDGTFLGVRAWESKLPGYGAVYDGKSFSIEHSFHGQLNNAINFFRGGSTIGGYITFSTYNGSEKMRITGTGNVGIGTTSPTEKLSVKGKIRAQEIKVEAAGVNWPDYVFDSSYKLMPLEKIEKYIAENGHLPEVPSAKEVGQDGLSVGSNQALLLKKIEELTLHLIDLKKQVQELEAKQISQASKKLRKEKKARRNR